MRRRKGNMWGEQFLGNVSTKQVHDLDNEQTRDNECQIDEIIAAGNDRPFASLEDAHAAGYGDCDYCL